MEIGIFISDKIEMYKESLKSATSERYTLHFSPNQDILNCHLISGNLAFIAFDINAKGVDFATLFYKVKALYNTIPVFLISDIKNIKNSKITVERIIGYKITKVFALKTELQNFIRTITSLPGFDTENQNKIKKLYKTIIGNSENTEQLKFFVSTVTKNDLPVLLYGPTGCGKNVVAKLIHDLSDRKNENFVHVNMGVIHEELMESVLFGAKKGSFTGACDSTIGLIELANNGTLFLDEIENAPLSLQIKLLAALENKKIRAVGDDTEKKIDFRLICATNKDLKGIMKQGEFRQDLYYRLNTLCFSIEPLKNRKSDIEIIAKYYCEKNGFRIDNSALRKLQISNLEGNIHELMSILDRAFIRSKPLNIIYNETIRF